MKYFLLAVLMTTLATQPVIAQTHNHDHGSEKKAVAPPRVFLDKNPRIVWYQLNRLDNERLLLVERKTDDPKYVPVFTAILIRAGMSPQHRDEALQGLVKLNSSDSASELLKALEELDNKNRQQQRTTRQLAGMLFRQSREVLRKKTKALQRATDSDNSMLRSIGYAGLIVAGESNSAESKAKQKEASMLDWLRSVPLVPSADLRSQLRTSILDLLVDSQSETIRRAAIMAIASIPKDQSDTFQLVAPFVRQPIFRKTAVRTLLRIPTKNRDRQTCQQLADVLVKHAETTPAAKRTTDEFIDAMQLTDQLLARVPVRVAKSYRERLRAVTVRVIRIHTVEEEMRYDTQFFAVEAGRPVQIVLNNEDLMPHNFVITVPGALKEVAQEGLILGPNPGFEGKPYVPKSDKVLFATGMVQSEKQARLTFTAPSEPGEYPYVCTFPRHWMRMYGVMVVVKDLDAWLQNPTKPKDPVGSNRAFVKAWKLDDFKGQLESGLRGRSVEIGRRIFTQASCAQCHKVNKIGGTVGPELTDVFKRWKGDRLAVMREVVDPSYRIDPKYAVQVIITLDGSVLTGIVTAENKASVSILVNPESPKPTVVQRSEIDEVVKTSKSMMPKALLDRFTKDEIFELIAFLESLNQSSK